MQIIDLRDAPEYIAQLARWHHAEWGYLNPDKTLADYTASMNDYLDAQAIPTMLIAVANGELLGSSSLIACDMDTRPELGPWLANVYVRADQRGRGLGGKLVKAIMALGGQLALSQLYLFTPDQDSFYRRLGWSPLERESFKGTDVSIMRLDY